MSSGQDYRSIHVIIGVADPTCPDHVKATLVHSFVDDDRTDIPKRGPQGCFWTRLQIRMKPESLVEQVVPPALLTYFG